MPTRSFVAPALALLLLATTANAQGSGRRSRTPQPAATAPLISFGEEKEWTIHYEVDVRPREPGVNISINNLAVRYEGRAFWLAAADIYFPVADETGSSDPEPGLLRAELWWKNHVNNDEPTLLKRVPGFGRYAVLPLVLPSQPNIATSRAELELDDRYSQNIRFFFEVGHKCRETRYDEARAAAVPWMPDPLPPDIQRWLEPELFIDPNHPAIRALVNQWTNGQPRSVNPALAAKAIAAHVVDLYQPSSFGVVTNTRAGFAGFDLRGSVQAAIDPRGAPYDMPCLLVAAWRAAGIPSRVVIGFDQPESDRLGGPVFRVWAEFLLHQPGAPDPEWIPVDILRQREFSSRHPPIEMKWEHFGNSEFLDDYTPIAFHFHPPDRAVGARGVIAYTAPALWGMTTDPVYATLDQNLNVWSFGTVKRGAD